MNSYCDIAALDGSGSMKAYLAMPAGKPKSGIVVIQEILGVNKDIRAMTDAWAWAAYCLLRDLLGKSQTREVLRQFEKSQQLGKVPNYLKHADKRPQAILKKHSETHTYITLALAIRLWTERGQPETSEMRAFSALPDPFKPSHRASEALTFARQGPITDQEAPKPRLRGITIATSTGGAEIIEKD